MKTRRLNPALRITQDAEERELRDLVSGRHSCLHCGWRVGVVTALRLNIERKYIGLFGHCTKRELPLEDPEPCSDHDIVAYVLP